MTEAAFFPAWALIREARNRAGLTQAQLAERAQTSQPAIAAYERARRLPDIPTLDRLVRACGFTLELRLGQADSQRVSAELAALERSVEDRISSNTSATRVASELRSSRG